MTRDSAYQWLRRTVTRFGRRRRFWALARGAGLFVAAAIGAFVAWALLDRGLGLGPWPRFVLFVAAVAAAGWAAMRWLVRPAMERVSLWDEALTIERRHGGLDNGLIGALQLTEEREAADATGRPLAHSAQLVDLLVAETAERVAEADLGPLIDRRRPARALAGGAGALVAAVLVATLAWSAVARQGDRLHDAWLTVLETLFPVTLEVAPGDTKLVRGQDVRLELTATGARRAKAELIRVPVVDGERKPAKARRDTLSLDDGRASLLVENAQRTFRYRFEYGRRRTKTYQVVVGERPNIESINYELVYPAYTGVAPQTLVGRMPKISGLVGTNVLVSLAATTKLDPTRSYVEWADGTKQRLQVSGRFADFSFTIERDTRATIHLTGKHGKGFAMKDPVSFDVVVQEDRKPRIAVKARKRKMTMLAKEAANFSLEWLAEDDFGVAEITANYKISAVDEMLGSGTREGSRSRVVQPARDRVRGTFKKLLADVSPPLKPGDKVEIRLTAKDNNTESGPGVGRSRTLEIVVVQPNLSGFAKQKFGFGARKLLGGLKKVKRATDLMVEPERTVQKQKKQDIKKEEIRSRATGGSWPAGEQAQIGRYFRLLSEQGRGESQ